MPENIVLRRKSGFSTLECNFSIGFYQGPPSSNFVLCLLKKATELRRHPDKKKVIFHNV